MASFTVDDRAKVAVWFDSMSVAQVQHKFQLEFCRNPPDEANIRKWYSALMDRDEPMRKRTAPEPIEMRNVRESTKRRRRTVANNSLTTHLEPIEKLPDDVLLIIFSHFKSKFICNRLALVCRRWLRLAYTKSLWHEVSFDITTSDRKRHESSAVFFSKMCDTIQSLSISCSFKRLSRDFISGHMFSSPMTAVTTLFQSIPSMLSVLIDRMPNVRSFEINSTRFSCCSQTATILNMIAEPTTWSNLRKLKYVFIAFAPNDSGTSFENLLKSKQQQFVSLSMAGGNLIDRWIQIMSKYQCESITELDLLHGSRNNRIHVRITDAAVLALTKCSKMSTLRLPCTFLTDIALGYIKLMINLTDLCLDRGKNFTSNGIRSLFVGTDGLRQLNHFRIESCGAFDDNCIDALTECCTNIETLGIFRCTISFGGFITIAERLSHIRLLAIVGARDCACLSANQLIRSPIFASLQLINFECSHWMDNATALELIDRKRNLVIINCNGTVIDWHNLEHASILERNINFADNSDRFVSWCASDGLRMLSR